MSDETIPAASFEDELAALEQAVDRLESGGLSLEEAIERFEAGFRAWKHCSELLESARHRIEVLVGEAEESENDEWSADREDELLGSDGGSVDGEGTLGE